MRSALLLPGVSSKARIRSVGGPLYSLARKWVLDSTTRSRPRESMVAPMGVTIWGSEAKRETVMLGSRVWGGSGGAGGVAAEDVVFSDASEREMQMRIAAKRREVIGYPENDDDIVGRRTIGVYRANALRRIARWCGVVSRSRRRWVWGR